MRNLIIASAFLLTASATYAQPRPHFNPGRGYGGGRVGSVYSYRAPARVYSPRVYGHGYGYGYRPVTIVRPSVYIPYAGISYGYSNGYFYRPYGGSYLRMMFPPIGIQVGFLPFGYMPLYVGPSLYYYNNGAYYQPMDDGRNYQVIDAPMGAELAQFPKGAKLVVVNGEQFYELNGTYYQRTVNDKGENVYKVVGKNGEINNSGPEEAEPNIGDTINDLPEGSKTVTINGEKYWVSPDNIYYREITDENNKISYEVVGKPSAGGKS